MLQKEWLIRKAKKHYLGPFDTESIKNLIREAELGSYDEIARSAQAWRYLKDCSPFAQLIEEAVPHSEEEKTIRLIPAEMTAPGGGRVSRGAVIRKVPPQREEPRMSKAGPKKPIIDLTVQREKTPLYKWGIVSMVIMVLGGIVWKLIPPPPREQGERGVPTGKGAITEPGLKELSETFQQYHLLFYQGKLEESAGEFRKAIQLYKQALRYNPDDVKAKVRLSALGFYYEGDREKSRKEFLKLLAMSNLPKPQWVEIQNYLGLLELKTHNYSEAISYFLKAIGWDDSFSPAHFNLGVSYFFQKQYYHARNHFDRAVQLQPNMPLIYLYLGRSLEKLNKDSDAIREYTNANRINPNLYFPYLYLSFIHFKLNQRKEAFSYLSRMIKRDPEYDQNTFKDIRYVQEEPNYDFVIQAYASMLKEKKLSSDVMAGLGLLYYLDGDKQRGVEWVEKAIRLNVKDDTAHTVHGFMLLKEGNFEKAIDALQTALRYQYQNALAHVLMGDIDIALGKYQEALEHCRTVLSFDPFSVRAYYTLGVALTHLDRVSEGVDTFNKALEYDPNYVPAKKMFLRYSK